MPSESPRPKPDAAPSAEPQEGNSPASADFFAQLQTEDVAAAGAPYSIVFHLVRLEDPAGARRRWWRGKSLCGKQHRSHGGVWAPTPHPPRDMICPACLRKVKQILKSHHERVTSTYGQTTSDPGGDALAREIERLLPFAQEQPPRTLSEAQPPEENRS